MSDPKLLFLGDVLYLPSSWPVHNVFSVGDVLIVAGISPPLEIDLAPLRSAVGGDVTGPATTATTARAVPGTWSPISGPRPSCTPRAPTTSRP